MDRWSERTVEPDRQKDTSAGQHRPYDEQARPAQGEHPAEDQQQPEQHDPVIGKQSGDAVQPRGMTRPVVHRQEQVVVTHLADVRSRAMNAG